MAYTEEDLIKKVVIDYEHKHVRVYKDRVIKRDGKKVGVVDQMRNHCCSFDPGQIQEVKQHIGRQDGDLVKEINAMWTPEVIAAHRARLERDS